MRLRKILSIAAVSTIGVAAVPASATIILTSGNNPQPDEINILFGASETGTTITGEVGATGIAADFTSTQSLTQNAQGQADIFATGSTPANPILLTNITFSLAPGFFFADFIMNPQGGSGTADVTVQPVGEPAAVFIGIALGNGQNFLTLTTAGGELMSSVSLSVTGGGFSDFKQPRVSGVCQVLAEGGPCVPIGEAPEPATVALFSVALLGLGLVRQRRV